MPRQATATEVAERIIGGTIAWTNPNGDVIIQPPDRGSEFVAAEGHGNLERSFELAAELRSRLIGVLASAMTAFRHEKCQKPQRAA